MLIFTNLVRNFHFSQIKFLSTFPLETATGIRISIILFHGPGSSVGIATDYGLDRPRIEFICVQDTELVGFIVLSE